LFEREHHRSIATVLEALNADLLLGHGCAFGGGTAIALRYGEYRVSMDIDLLVSSRAGYRALRELVTSAGGVQALARPGAKLNEVRQVRVDQYGMRTMLDVIDVEIKFEIVHEGRVELELPGPADRICGVATLTPLDMATTKLLANSDRWADDGVQSRDLIDLAMMAPPRKLLNEAIAKASAAYGETVERDLSTAIERLRERPNRLDECMRALNMTNIPKALLWKRIRALRPASRRSRTRK
jgi:hypothetical protein